MSAYDELDEKGKKAVAVIDLLEGMEISEMLNVLQEAVACAIVLAVVEEDGSIDTEFAQLVLNTFADNVNVLLGAYHDKHKDGEEQCHSTH